MKLKRIHLFLGLLLILLLLYTVNIFYLNKITDSLLGNPVRLSITIINANKDQCSDCFNTTGIVNFITSSNKIKITRKRIITPESFEYKNLIIKDKIKNLPAIIVSGDITNIKIAKIIKLLPGKEENGNIIIQNLPPYYDIGTQEKKGFIKVVLLEDKSCSNCFNVKQYLGTLKRLGIAVSTSSIYDVSSPNGKLYVKKYNIKKVPTMLISPETNIYPGFRKLWENVGTIAPDGWFIFRKVQSTGGKFSNI